MTNDDLFVARYCCGFFKNAHDVAFVSVSSRVAARGGNASDVNTFFMYQKDFRKYLALSRASLNYAPSFGARARLSRASRTKFDSRSHLARVDDDDLLGGLAGLRPDRLHDGAIRCSYFKDGNSMNTEPGGCGGDDVYMGAGSLAAMMRRGLPPWQRAIGAPGQPPKDKRVQRRVRARGSPSLVASTAHARHRANRTPCRVRAPNAHDGLGRLLRLLVIVLLVVIVVVIALGRRRRLAVLGHAFCQRRSE